MLDLLTMLLCSLQQTEVSGAAEATSVSDQSNWVSLQLLLCCQQYCAFSQSTRGQRATHSRPGNGSDWTTKACVFTMQHLTDDLVYSLSHDREYSY